MAYRPRRFYSDTPDSTKGPFRDPRLPTEPASSPARNQTGPGAPRAGEDDKTALAAQAQIEDPVEDSADSSSRGTERSGPVRVADPPTQSNIAPEETSAELLEALKNDPEIMKAMQDNPELLDTIQNDPEAIQALLEGQDPESDEAAIEYGDMEADSFGGPSDAQAAAELRLSETDDPEEAQKLARAIKLHKLSRLRIVPASKSYFTALPTFTDDLLHLSALARKHALLPTVPAAEAPRVAWVTYNQYTLSNTEPIRKSQFAGLIRTLQRLNQIHPSLAPEEVKTTLQRFKRAVQPNDNKAKPIPVDAYGRARAVGRRKSSHAVVWLVQGTGDVRVNGLGLGEVFARLHDRESALWALKATGRMDRYNVWIIVRGGGTTGQAEAVTLGLAKALLAHEPALKPALRRAGCVTRDKRVVERKKPGKLKARKMPAWVKR